MAEVSVEINGRKFRMACEDGEEDHLIGLANKFNAQVEGFKGAFGEIGDNRLTVMAGIAVLDQLAEAEKKIETLQAEVGDAHEVNVQIADGARALEAEFIKKLSETARKIEAATIVVDETTPASGDS